MLPDPPRAQAHPTPPATQRTSIMPEAPPRPAPSPVPNPLASPSVGSDTLQSMRAPSVKTDPMAAPLSPRTSPDEISASSMNLALLPGPESAHAIARATASASAARTVDPSAVQAALMIAAAHGWILAPTTPAVPQAGLFAVPAIAANDSAAAAALGATTAQRLCILVTTTALAVMMTIIFFVVARHRAEISAARAQGAQPVAAATRPASAFQPTRSPSSPSAPPKKLDDAARSAERRR